MGENSLSEEEREMQYRRAVQAASMVTLLYSFNNTFPTNMAKY